MAEVIVVSGLPRSGTSLSMQMLGAAGIPLLVDSARAADEDNPRGYFEYSPVKRIARDVSWVGDACGHAVKVIAPLISELPTGYEYRVILMRRAIDEVLASQARMLARLGSGRDFEGDGLPELHERIFRDAERWCEENSRHLVVAHAELLREPEAGCRRICSWLELSQDRVPAMVACVEPALHRQRTQPSA